jgi:hypothetical protein
MKKLFFLPLVLISCLCFAQDAKEIIGKPVKVGNLLVAEKDFLLKFNWEEAKKVCADLGEGWRLPTKTELNILYKSRDKIRGFSESNYWSSDEYTKNAWLVDFSSDIQGYYGKWVNCNIRAVKSL